MEPRVLILLTDEISAVLVRGQLRHLRSAGFSLTVGVHRADPGAPHGFDPDVDVRSIDFVRQPSLRADLRALRQTIRLIREVRPDIVHASTPKAGLLGMLAARIARVRVRVYQVRGLRYESAHGAWRRLYRTTERWACHLATHVLFNSESLSALAQFDKVVHVGRGQVLGSGNGVDTDRFSPPTLVERHESRQRFGMPDDSLVIGFVGRLTRDKGIDDLLDAFESLTTEGVRLLLVGSFESGDAVSAHTVSRIEHSPNITHIDWIDDPSTVYPSIDILAFPSFREGLPNVPLEAQACGVPVVGYAATGTVDAVADGRTGILVPVGDRRALAGALDLLLCDGTLRETMGREARDHVIENFRPDDVWTRIELVYRSALAPHRST